MQLKYRGTTYSYNPAQAGVSAPMTLTYRGQHYCRTNQADPVSHQMLRYRGVTYQLGQQVESCPQPAQPIATVPMGLAQQHRQNLLTNLHHRIEVAQAQGDDRLLNLLAAERRQLAA